MVYHDISAVRQCGLACNFILDDYIDKNADAHDKLLDLKEVVSESKQVEDFLQQQKSDFLNYLDSIDWN